MISLWIRCNRWHTLPHSNLIVCAPNSICLVLWSLGTTFPSVPLKGYLVPNLWCKRHIIITGTLQRLGHTTDIYSLYGFEKLWTTHPRWLRREPTSGSASTVHYRTAFKFTPCPSRGLGMSPQCPSVYYTHFPTGKAMYFGPDQSILRNKPYGGLMGINLPAIQESVWRYNIIDIYNMTLHYTCNRI